MTYGVIVLSAAIGLLTWGAFELVAYLRWRSFLKLLDERLGDRSDGSRLTAPNDFKLLHGRKDAL